jgi:hypothetical protein
MPLPFSRPVPAAWATWFEVLTESVFVRIRQGNGSSAYTETEVFGCVVQLLPSDEDNGRGHRVTTTGDVILPPDTVLTSVDRLRIRGLDFQIVGEPVLLGAERDGSHAGWNVSVRRTTR